MNIGEDINKIQENIYKLREKIKKIPQQTDVLKLIQIHCINTEIEDLYLQYDVVNEEYEDIDYFDNNRDYIDMLEKNIFYKILYIKLKIEKLNDKIIYL